MAERDLGWETSDPSLSEETVAIVEEYFGVRFPEEYRATLIRYPSAWPKLSGFSFTTPDGRHRGSGIGMLLSADQASSENIIAVHKGMGRYGDPKVIPISDDGGGDYVCLDYRRADPHGEPSVSYFEHELLEIHALAETYSAFCATLTEPVDLE